jgi:hypothetical protein
VQEKAAQRWHGHCYIAVRAFPKEIFMVPRLLTLATITFVGMGLASSAALAEEPQGTSSATAIEQAQKTIVPLPTTSHRSRISTRDRWRGTPYLRSTADETLRSHALDVALPSANSAFQGGVDLQQPHTFVYEDFVRQEALNKALIPANPSIVGGGTPRGGVGF